MVAYKTELNSIVDFDAWSGGRDALNRVIEADKIDELDQLIDTLQAGDEVWTDTQLNDFLWFDLENYDGFSYDELQKAIKKVNGDDDDDDDDDDDE